MFGLAISIQRWSRIPRYHRERKGGGSEHEKQKKSNNINNESRTRDSELKARAVELSLIPTLAASDPTPEAIMLILTA